MCVGVCVTILLADVEHCTFRTLGTPNNDVWPDVESLPDYKNTFPKWKSGNLSVKNLEKNGLDLLAVRIQTRPWFWCGGGGGCCSAPPPCSPMVILLVGMCT